MSLFRILGPVDRRLKRIQRGFIWARGSKSGKKVALCQLAYCGVKAAWGSKGPLLNRALLGKWVRQFAIEKEAPWRIYISLKFGTDFGAWFTKETRRSYGINP